MSACDYTTDCPHPAVWRALTRDDSYQLCQHHLAMGLLALTSDRHPTIIIQRLKGDDHAEPHSPHALCENRQSCE